MLRWACRFCDSNTGPAVIILVDVSSAFSWFGRESNQNDNSTASIYLTEFALDRVRFSKVYPNLAPPSYKFPPFLFSHSQWVTPLSSSESICPRQCLTNLSGRNNWHPPAGRALYLKWWKLYCKSSKLNGFRLRFGALIDEEANKQWSVNHSFPLWYIVLLIFAACVDPNDMTAPSDVAFNFHRHFVIEAFAGEGDAGGDAISHFQWRVKWREGGEPGSDPRHEVALK